ncbi:MAG TPA: hypothetical protein VIM01_09445 [Dermatophilaceae bacterium]|jgi:hypothetical protein
MQHDRLLTEGPSSAGIPRRSFLKWSGAPGDAAALVTTGAHFGVLPGDGAANAEATVGLDVDRTTWVLLPGVAAMGMGALRFLDAS